MLDVFDGGLKRTETCSTDSSRCARTTPGSVSRQSTAALRYPRFICFIIAAVRQRFPKTLFRHKFVFLGTKWPYSGNLLRNFLKFRKSVAKLPGCASAVTQWHVVSLQSNAAGSSHAVFSVEFLIER